MDETKSYEISKHVVVEAFQRVKANKGAAGIDGEDLETFESNLRTTSIRFGTECHQGAIFHQQLKRWKYRRRTAERACLECQLRLIE